MDTRRELTDKEITVEGQDSLCHRNVVVLSIDVENDIIFSERRETERERERERSKITVMTLA